MFESNDSILARRPTPLSGAHSSRRASSPYISLSLSHLPRPSLRLFLSLSLFPYPSSFFLPGFFIGDGAGIGKGRQISATILDALCRNHGCGRHLWVSVSRELVQDARRDLADVGCHVSDGGTMAIYRA